MNVITGNVLGDYFQTQYILGHILGLVFLVLGLGLFIERKGLDYLIIPTGDDLDQMKRAKRAAQEKANHYIISGLESQENVLAWEELRKANIDPMKVISENKSTDTLENVMNSIKKMENPESIGIVSYPEHLKRYEMIIEKAKEEGKIQKDVEMKYIPVRQSLRETVYGILANVKEKVRLRKGIDSALEHKRKRLGDTLKKNLENKKED